MFSIYIMYYMLNSALFQCTRGRLPVRTGRRHGAIRTGQLVYGQQICVRSQASQHIRVFTLQPPSELLLICTLHTYTIGRKNETEIIFVVILQINQYIPKLISNTQTVYNCKHLAYTVKTRFEMSQNICKSSTNIISVSFFLPIPVYLYIIHFVY